MKTPIVAVLAGLSLLTIFTSGTANDHEKIQKPAALFDAQDLQSIKALPSQALPTIRLKSGTIWITAKVAATPEHRAIGLSGRNALHFNQGMLFVWPTAGRYCMWMRDTSLPLTALFLSDQGEVLGLEAMTPKSLDRHCAPKPVRFILEVPWNWQGKERIVVGSLLSGLTQAPDGQ